MINQTAQNAGALANAALINCAAWSISCSVVNLPRLKRIVRAALRASCPKARSTWDGALLAELHAEVAEKAMPALNAAELNSPSLKVRLNVCGIRWVELPLRRKPATDAN